MRIEIKQRPSGSPISTKFCSVINFNKAEGKIAWQKFLTDYPYFNFDYTLESLEYRSELLGSKAVNESFVICQKNGTPIAICPVFCCERKQTKPILSFGPYRFAPSPLFHPDLTAKQQKFVEKLVADKIQALLLDKGASSWLVYADILSVGTEAIEDQLPARFGGLDVSISQHILDLKECDKKLWSRIRKRAHSEINAGLAKFNFKIYDKYSFHDDIGKRFTDLHHKTAGRRTRSDQTFETTYEWIKKDTAFLVEQTHVDKPVNMTLVEIGKGSATGASTADDPEFISKVPLMHSMMWTIILECKRRGVEFFNSGETFFRSSPHNIVTNKEMNISFFKSGFGNRSWPLKRWILFATITDEMEYLEKQFSQYKSSIVSLKGGVHV